MKKIRIQLSLLILLLCFSVVCKAQWNSGTLSSKFDAYNSVWHKTYLHLVLNQEKFAPGDTVWFKAYFLNEDLSVVASNQLIDLNLIDSNGDSKVHFVFNLENGIGHNQIAIPSDLSAGNYLITAYASWMKNFDTRFIFKKQIAIVKENTIVPVQKPIIQLAVEGTHLVRDIANKIVIQTSLPLATVQVINSAGQEVQQFTSDVNGLAFSSFIPKSGEHYFARVIGDTTRTSLPNVDDDGIALQLKVHQSKSEPIQLTLASPTGSALRNEELSILITSKGKTRFSTSFTQSGKDNPELQIPQEKMAEGINQLSVLKRDGTLLASRLFYSNQSASVAASIQISPTTLVNRQKVKLEVSLVDGKGQPVDGEFSVGIINEELFSEEPINSLSDELNILSTVTQKFIINRIAADWFTALDQQLILNTIEISWNDILKTPLSQPAFPFSSVIQKSGKVLYSDTREPVPELTQLTFYLQNSKKLYHTFVDKGKVSFAIPAVYGQDEIFYLAQTKRKPIPNVVIEWDADNVQLPLPPKSRQTKSIDRYAYFAGKGKLINKSYGFYENPNQVNSESIKNSIADFEDEIMGADVTINIQNYILFSTMQEMVHEVVGAMYTRGTGEKSMVRVKLPEPMNSNVTGDPVYVIDDVATKSTAFFLSLKPAEVLYIKVVKDPMKLSRFGLMGRNGIVIVETKNGNTREQIDPSLVVRGLNKALLFKTPDYGNSVDLIRPDFRSTLFWNPIVKTTNGKAIVEFYSSDDVGKMKILINGMAETNAFSAEKTVEIGLSSHKN